MTCPASRNASKNFDRWALPPCKYLVTKRPLTQAETEDGIKQLQQYAKDSDIPIDGIVVTYNDIAFSKDAGAQDITIRTGWRSNLRTSCLRQHFVPSVDAGTDW